MFSFQSGTSCPYAGDSCGLCRYYDTKDEFPGSNDALYDMYRKIKAELAEAFEMTYSNEVKFSGCVLKLKHGEKDILVSANFETGDSDITSDWYGNVVEQGFRDKIDRVLSGVYGYIRTVTDEATFIIFKDKESGHQCVRHKVQLLLAFETNMTK